MKKTRRMLEAEKKIGEPLENYLSRLYIDEWKSSVYIGKNLGVCRSSISDWLRFFGIGLKKEGRVDYLAKFYKKPPRGVMKFYYEYKRESVPKIAKVRSVSQITIYRWLKKEGVEMRTGSNKYLKRGIIRPSCKKLSKLLRKYGEKRVMNHYGVCRRTLVRWKEQAGLLKKRKSRYDNSDLRRNMLLDLVKASGKSLRGMVYADFENYKQENGRSYLGLREWYLGNYNCFFRKAKQYMKQDLDGKLDSACEETKTSKLSLESSL